MEGKKYALLLSYDLLDEIADVLLNPRLLLKYNYSLEDVESLIMLCKKQAIIINPATIIQICRDPDDDKIINCAIMGRSHCLVSGDSDLGDDTDLKRALFEYGVKVIRSEIFVEIFGVEESS
jgi:putative PIN family toxin of toxin-antitoxin system